MSLIADVSRNSATPLRWWWVASVMLTTPLARGARPPACYPGDEKDCCCPGCCPGWGWRAHGGLLPLPWPTDWSVNGSIASYFVGNASGYNSEQETAAGSELGVYGIGWELDNIPTHNTDIEPAELAAAAALKARNPAMKIGVTRNSVVATTFWNTARKVQPASAGQHLHYQTTHHVTPKSHTLKYMHCGVLAPRSCCYR